MKILTGKDKLAYERLELAVQYAFNTLSYIGKHQDVHNPLLIKFTCTDMFINEQKNRIKSALKGYRDYVIKENKE